MASPTHSILHHRTKSAEVLFFHHHQFQDLKRQARCSASSIVRLACAIALKIYSSNESVNLVFQGKDRTWQHWSRDLPRGDRLLSLLSETNYINADSHKPSEETGLRYALSVSALEDDLQNEEDSPSLLKLKNIFPEVNCSLFLSRTTY